MPYASVDRAFAGFKERGSDEDLIALLEACRRGVFNSCFRLLRNREDAEDAVQLVLFEVAKHADSMLNAECFKSWLFQVGRARSLDLRKRRAVQERHESQAAIRGESNGNGSALHAAEARQVLFAAISALPEEDRALVVAHYLEKVPLRSLADRRGCSKVAVWKRLERIRARLRQRLAGAGLSAAIPFMESWLAEMKRPAVTGPSRSPPKTGGRPRPVPTGTVGTIAGIGMATWITASTAAVLLLALGVALGATRKPRTADLSPAAGVAARDNGAPAPHQQVSALVSKPARTAPKPAATAAPGAEKPGDDLKERLRRLFRRIQDQRSGLSPELETAADSFNDMIRAAHRDPSNRPEEFAEFVGLLYEVAGEEIGMTFSSENRRRMARLREDLAAGLSRVPQGPAPVRLLAAVEADLAFARGMAEIVPQDDAGKMMLSDIDRILKRGKRKSMPQERLVREIVADWTAAIGAEAARAPFLAESAKRLACTLARITEDYRGRFGDTYDEDDYLKNTVDRVTVLPYDPVRRMEYQVEALKTQIEALNFIRDGLDPARGELLLESEPWNYAVSRKGTLIDIRH